MSVATGVGRRAIAVNAASASGLHVARPAGALRHYVDHYWIGLSNQEDAHAVVPDGAVDLVLSVGRKDFRAELFGTTTTRVDVPLVRGNHYLGIRFKAGQSRHFCRCSAAELTDARMSAEDLNLQGMEELAASVAEADVYARMDTWLMRTLARNSPRPSGIDAAIQQIESASGKVCVGALAHEYGKSRRQFERHFLDTVGVSPKLFAEIVRFQRSLVLLSTSILPLAQVAAELGYADQSHLTHAFSRFYGAPPSRARRHVAFVQDDSLSPEDNARS